MVNSIWSAQLSKCGITTIPTYDTWSSVNNAQRAPLKRLYRFEGYKKHVILFTITCDELKTISTSPGTKMKMIHYEGYFEKRACILLKKIDKYLTKLKDSAIWVLDNFCIREDYKAG